MSYSHLIELIRDGLGVAVLIKEGICYDKCLLCTSDTSQLVKSYRQTTFLDVYLFRRSEPKHIFPSFCYCFDVDKVLDTYVFGNGVSAP